MYTVTEKLEYLKGCFGENYQLSRSGDNVAFQCPACGRGTEKLKFSICLETFMCHCWVCDIKGKTPYFIIKKYCDSDRAERFKRMFKIRINDEDVDEPIVDVVRFPNKFKMLATIKNPRDPDLRDCLRYLKSRGVTEELLWRHKIGTFVGRRLTRRVVFPSFDSKGILNYYVSRTIDGNGFPKYLNCKADKTSIVFDEAKIDWKKELMIVEGVFDMIKCGLNTTCLLGSSLNEKHKLFHMIVKNKTPVILALDADMLSKTYRIAKELSSYDVQVKIFDLGGYQDIGSMSSEIVRQKCKSAPIYSSESRLHHLIGTISSGSLF